MTVLTVIDNMLLPALQILRLPDTFAARVIVLAIGMQESRFEYRRQMNSGPAMGFWQFERGGGVRGVLRHPASAALARTLCAARGVDPEEYAAWAALEHDDVLAAGFARLLLLTDPRPLPTATDADGAWQTYLRNWRPGKPHPETWPALHARAVALAQE